MKPGARSPLTGIARAGALGVALLAATLASPQADTARHGNPSDLDGYAARLVDPGRDSWQKPDAVVALLGLGPGQTACDVGSGPGYFTLRLARAVGADGHVYAVDVEPRMLDALRKRLAAAGTLNVTPVLGLDSDPLLADGLCDVVLIVDTYHHFPDGAAYLRRLTRSLTPNGRVVNVDYVKRQTAVGPPLAHRISREDFLRAADQAGYSVQSEPDLLPYQYVVVLAPRRAQN